MPVLPGRSHIRGSGFGLFRLGGFWWGIGRRAGQAIGPRGLLALEFFEGAVIVALAGIDEPLKALKVGRAGAEGVSGIARLEFLVCGKVGFARVLPEDGFDAAHAAEAPFVVNESVDEESLGGVGRGVLCANFGIELGEVVFVFVEHDLAIGDDAVFAGVEAGCGVRLGYAGVGGLCRVATDGGALLSSGHGGNLGLSLADEFGTKGARKGRSGQKGPKRGKK